MAALGAALLVAGCAGSSSVEVLQARFFGPVSVVVPEGWGSAELRGGEVHLVDLDPPEGLESFMGSDFAPWTLLATGRATHGPLDTPGHRDDLVAIADLHRPEDVDPHSTP